jgi:chemotaxis protein methyltransferase CheR
VIEAPPLPMSEANLRGFVEAIYSQYHYDFRGYAVASLKRRLNTALLKFRCASLAHLQEFMLRDASAFSALLDYLTVQVSAMFRDPGYFLELRRSVVPLLRTYPSVKIWVAGCSAGEEVYSLAILLREEGLLDRSLIYATDINPHALARAEAGVFPLDRIAEFSENYLASGARGSLSDYYSAAYGSAMLDKSLREHMVFADHSLATDSVFAEVQFVSCRNVLIYFNRVLQDRAVGLFADALCRKGFLGIGAKESIRFSKHAAVFEALSADNRIYRKRGETGD